MAQRKNRKIMYCYTLLCLPDFTISGNTPGIEPVLIRYDSIPGAVVIRYSSIPGAESRWNGYNPGKWQQVVECGKVRLG